MITLQEAKNLYQGQTIYDSIMKNADGSAARYRVSSVKTWKRDPNRIRVGLKYGLYSYGELTNGTYEGGRHFSLRLDEVMLEDK